MCNNSFGACDAATTIAAHTTVCPAAGGGVPFNAPEVWDGTCTTMDPVSSADSLTVAPPSPPDSQDECQPAEAMLGLVAFHGGKTIAELCFTQSTGIGDVPGNCQNGDLCTYPSVPGFLICSFLGLGDGAQPCSAGWTEKHLYFDRGAACSCSCGAPMGEVCSSTVTAYEDSACSKPVGSVTAASNESAACVDVSPNSALGSKSATAVYTAGTCKPELTLAASTTLCCLP
jgi:hypothetical protein